MSSSRTRLVAVLAVGSGWLIAAAPALAYSVTNTNDSGNGSLRAAIAAANAHSGLDSITFAIGSGAHTITPHSALPAITDPVEILGPSQPGFSGAPLIELYGGSAGTASGLSIGAGGGGSVIAGLAVDGWSQNGVAIAAGGNTLADDWFGTGPNGVRANGAGVEIVNGADNTIDGRFCTLSCSTTTSYVVGNGTGIVISGSQSTGNRVTRTDVGVTPSILGTVAHGNANVGIRIASSASGNTIGGTTADDRDVISGNPINVELDSGAHGNTVQGSYIGTNIAGTAALGGSYGVFIHAASSNTIGGTSTGARNIISGNGVDGVEICGTGLCNAGADSPGNVVEGNWIGTNAAGSAAVGNGMNASGQLGAGGVYIYNATGNTIGGSAVGAGNVVSGNRSGVTIETEGTLVGDNTVGGNVIGMAANGSDLLGNLNNGVDLADGNNSLVTGNTVSGNDQGIVIRDLGGSAGNSNSNEVDGNNVGVDGSGTVAAPNSLVGILLSGDTSLNSIDSNTISGNGGPGVKFQAGTFAPSQNTVDGNLIGTSGDGTFALANSGDGILDQSQENSFGGNLISGNTGNGISMSGLADSVVGNMIGTDAGGSSALPNGGIGVLVGGASASLTNNLIAGNDDDGVDLASTGALLTGNTIGTNAAGTAALPNNHGIFVTGSGNTIGSAFTGNLISGNRANGIWLSTGADSTAIQSNLIGSDAAGTTAIPNGNDGILVSGVTGTTIGGSTTAPGTAPGNIVAGNQRDGIELQGPGTSGTTIQGNLLGKSGVPNAGDGLLITKSSHSLIGGTATGVANRIAFNGVAGVFVNSGTRNAIRGNSIVSNGRLGIDLSPSGENANVPGGSTSGPNLRENHPVLTSAVKASGAVTVTGTFNSTPNTKGFVIEFFSSPVCDPSGFGEGQRFLGSTKVATDAGGNASFSVALTANVAAGAVVTATATDHGGNTSEFSACVSRT